MKGKREDEEEEKATKTKEKRKEGREKEDTKTKDSSRREGKEEEKQRRKGKSGNYRKTPPTKTRGDVALERCREDDDVDDDDDDAERRKAALVDAETQADLAEEDGGKAEWRRIAASYGLGYVDPTPIAPLIVDPGRAVMVVVVVGLRLGLCRDCCCRGCCMLF